jgi:hypothetical protein
VQPTPPGSTVIEASTPKPPPASPPIVERSKPLIAHPAFDTVILGVILPSPVP